MNTTPDMTLFPLKFKRVGAMKVETLLLALVARFFEAGIREKVTYIPEPIQSSQQVCNCDCTCGCTTVWEISLVGAGVIVLLLALLGLVWNCCRPKGSVSAYHGSPRRKGLGTVTVPSW